MQTTPVPRDRCGTVKSGWLETAHPSVEDGKVRINVCFVLSLPIVEIVGQFL